MNRFEGVVFDVDGTLVWGDDPVPGAAAAVAAARERGPVAFVTNNPVAPPEAYVDRLAAAGVEADVDEVVTAGRVTADLVAEEYPDPAYVVGESGLVERLRERDVTVTDRPAAAGEGTVVASIDRSLGYDDLVAALRAFEAGDPAFVGTDPDPVIPGEEGLVPGSGAVVDAVASVAGRQPDAMAGKPGAPARTAAFDALGVPAERALVVGDRRETDIALGARSGATTALVLSGVTDRADLNGAVGDGERAGATADGGALVADPGAVPTPDHVLESVAALPERF